MKKILSIIFAISLLSLLVWIIYWIITQVWGQFKLLDPKVSVAILAASTTVIVSTLTVVLGKYYERKRDIEAHYREKKLEIYDEFLSEFFKVFHSSNDDDKTENTDLVNFLREWQRKIILWGGQDVLSKYVAWMGNLKKGIPNAQTMFLMEEFFIEIRKDLGHKTNKLGKGTFVQLMLKEHELFLAMAKENPNISLDELAEIENQLNTSKKEK